MYEMGDKKLKIENKWSEPLEVNDEPIHKQIFNGHKRRKISLIFNLLSKSETDSLGGNLYYLTGVDNFKGVNIQGVSFFEKKNLRGEMELGHAAHSQK